jgi:putative transcriptional regulator
MNLFLVQIRKQAGLSQQQVAEEIGVSKSTLNRWEQGKSSPYRLHRAKLCAYSTKQKRAWFLDSTSIRGTYSVAGAFRSFYSGSSRNAYRTGPGTRSPASTPLRSIKRRGGGWLAGVADKGWCFPPFLLRHRISQV